MLGSLIGFLIVATLLYLSISWSHDNSIKMRRLRKNKWTSSLDKKERVKKMRLVPNTNVQIIYGDKVLRGNVLQTDTVGDNSQITIDLAMAAKLEPSEPKEWFIVHNYNNDELCFAKKTLSEVGDDINYGDIDDYVRLLDCDDDIKTAILKAARNNYVGDEKIEAAVEIAMKYCKTKIKDLN